mmetsp:Transcript_13108/g.27728  ORF Transcript_13108/g.27728 Transcript_13108/m.27728 type:complete len:533 (+) Transcript_13108:65-1663(+)
MSSVAAPFTHPLDLRHTLVLTIRPIVQPIARGSSVRVFLPQNPLANGQSPLKQRPRLTVPPHVVVEPPHVVQTSCHHRMVGLVHLLPDGEAALIQGQRLVVLAHALVQHREVVQTFCHLRMLRLVHLLPDGEAALIQGQRLVVLAHVGVQPREVVQTSRHVRMVGPVHLLLDGEASLEQGQRLVVLAHLPMHARQVVQSKRYISIVLLPGGRLLRQLQLPPRDGQRLGEPSGGAQHEDVLVQAGQLLLRSAPLPPSAGGVDALGLPRGALQQRAAHVSVEDVESELLLDVREDPLDVARLERLRLRHIHSVEHLAQGQSVDALRHDQQAVHPAVGERLPHLVQAPHPPQRLPLLVEVERGGVGLLDDALEAVDVALRLRVLVLVDGEDVDPHRNVPSGLVRGVVELSEQPLHEEPEPSLPSMGHEDRRRLDIPLVDQVDVPALLPLHGGLDELLHQVVGGEVAIAPEVAVVQRRQKLPEEPESHAQLPSGLAVSQLFHNLDAIRVPNHRFCYRHVPHHRICVQRCLPSLHVP